MTSATSAWFVAAATADLHLASTAFQAIDQVILLTDVTADIDGDPRPSGATTEAGADEFFSLPSLDHIQFLPAILDLH